MNGANEKASPATTYVFKTLALPVKKTSEFIASLKPQIEAQKLTIHSRRAHARHASLLNSYHKGLERWLNEKVKIAIETINET